MSSFSTSGTSAYGLLLSYHIFQQWRNCLSAHKHCAYLLAPKFLKMTIENPSDPPYNTCLMGSVLNYQLKQASYAPVQVFRLEAY